MDIRKSETMTDKPLTPAEREFTKKRQEPVFWLDNGCPFCNHSAPLVYTPDLLNGPIEFECPSQFNPMRKYKPCAGKWSVAIEIKKKNELRDLLELAKRQDSLYSKINENRTKLGYK